MNLKELQGEIQRALHADPPAARRLLRRYESVARRSDDEGPRAMAVALRAQLDHVTGRLAAAARGYETARTALQKAGERRWRDLMDVGAIQVEALLGRRERVATAARRLRRSLREPVQRAGAEIAIGNALENLGDDRRAEQAYENALDALRRRRAPAAVGRLRAIARHQRGICLARRGALSEARKQLAIAMRTAQAACLELLSQIVRHTLAWVNGLIGAELGAALEELREVQGSFERLGAVRLAALARLDEAELVARMGDVRSGRVLARSAATALRRQGAALAAARADILDVRCTLALGGRGARTAAKRARRMFVAAGDRAGAAQVDVLLGERLATAERTLASRGHLVGAFEALLARARAARPSAGARLIERHLPNYPAALHAWAKPDLLRLRAEARGADRLRLLRRAFREAEKLRGLAPTSALRASSLATHLSIYERFASALLDRGRARDRAEAFLVLDAARARTLRDEMHGDSEGADPSPAVRRLRERLESLWRVLDRRASESDDLRRSQVELLRDVSACERRLVSALRAARPGAAAIGPPARLPTQPRLAFAVLAGRCVGFIARAGAVETWDAGPMQPLLHTMERFRFQVTRRLFGAEDSAAAISLLDRIGALLFDGAPALPPGRLVVVLPPELGSLPIEAVPYRGRALVETVPVVFAPCASVANSEARWALDARALVVGVGGASLPEVKREVRAVAARLVDADVLCGEDAGRNRVLAAVRGKRIIHVASHASTRDDIPALSALRVRDGWVTSADLRADLRGALVVMSACRSGDPGLVADGEAMGGFPRAFLAAGARSIVASRWEVPDDIARLWMRYFYEAMDGRSPEKAVRAAALRVRKRFPHPADWACFLAIRGGH